MRKIRFRAWYGGEMYRTVFVGGTQVPQVMKDYFRPVNLCAHTEEYHVMQFTGLTDKNGKEIYEGDVLKSFLHSDSPCEVIYDESMCAFRITDGITEEPLFDTASENDYGRNIWEVIGNVYENPELLSK